MYGASSNIASSVDSLFFFMLGVCAFFLLLITGLIILFSIRYRRSRHPRAEQIEGNTLLEIVWTVVPIILVMGMFYYGVRGFELMRDVPSDAMVVQVTGRMWDWSFRYENGKEADRLFVPVGRPVKLALQSLDVNHSFFIPAFRVKEDVIPGRENYLWFKPQTIGPVDIFCAEYCGQRHSYMMSEVIIMDEAEFAAWLDDGAPVIEEAGVRGLLRRHGCLDCHSVDGRAGRGPTFAGLFGARRTVIRDGREVSVVADEEYLRRAITKPHSEFVREYERNMPEPVDLSPTDVEAIIDFLQALESPADANASGPAAVKGD